MRNSYPVTSHVINYLSVIPFLYRYENQEYIDNFFDTGELFISSFHNYKKYEDNDLGDTNEGSSFNTAKLDNDMALSTLVSAGMNEYSFCTSTILDNKLLIKFSRNSVFRIKDPLNFIFEITKSLLRVQQVLHGYCLYLDKRMLTKSVPNVKFDDFKVEGGISLDKMVEVSNYVQGLDSFFLKEKKYQHQSEYRILWQTDREVRNGILINCPEAIKYCEKIDLNNYY